MLRRWVDDRRRRCVRLHDSFGECCEHRVYWNATKLLNWREVGRTNGVVVGGVVVGGVVVVGEGVGPGVGNVAVVVGSVLVRAGAVDRGTAVLRYRVGSGSCSLVLMVLIVVGGVEVHWIVAIVGGRCVDGSAEGIVGGGGTVDDRVPGVVFWIEVRVGPRPACWMLVDAFTKKKN